MDAQLPTTAPSAQSTPAEPKFSADLASEMIKNQGKPYDQVFDAAYSGDPDFKKNVDYMKTLPDLKTDGTPENEMEFKRFALSNQYFNNDDLPPVDHETANIVQMAKQSATVPFSNADSGSGNSNPLSNAAGMAGNFASEVGGVVAHPIDTLKSMGQGILGMGELAARQFLKSFDQKGGTNVIGDLKSIVDRHPEDQSLLANALRSLVGTSPEQRNILDTAKTYGIDAGEGKVYIADPHDPNKQTMVKGMFEHPLLPSLIFGGAVGNSSLAEPINNAFDSAQNGVVEGVKDIANKIPGVQGVKNYIGDRSAFTNAESASTPFEKMAMPEMKGATIDEAAKNGRTAITNASGDPMTFTHGPNDTAVAGTLEKIPEFKSMVEGGADPNANPLKANQIIENARDNTFGPAVQDSAKQIKFAFSNSDVKGLLQDTFDRLNENNKVIASTEGVWEKTMSNYLKKFNGYIKQGMSPSESLWKTGSDMRLSIPESTLDSTTSAQGAAIRAFTKSANDYLSTNAERIAGTLDEVNPEQAAQYRQFKTAMQDYRNIMQAQENLKTKLPNKTVGAPPSPGEIVKSVVKKTVNRAAFGAAAGLGVEGVTKVLP